MDSKEDGSTSITGSSAQAGVVGLILWCRLDVGIHTEGKVVPDVL